MLFDQTIACDRFGPHTAPRPLAQGLIGGPYCNACGLVVSRATGGVVHHRGKSKKASASSSPARAPHTPRPRPPGPGPAALMRALLVVTAGMVEDAATEEAEAEAEASALDAAAEGRAPSDGAASQKGGGHALRGEPSLLADDETL